MAESEKEAALPPKEEFSEWYNELLWMAEIMDVRYPVKGLYVWYPFGFAIRRNTYNIIREICMRPDPHFVHRVNGSFTCWAKGKRDI